MRALCWTLSILLHVTLAATLFQAVDPVPPEPEELIELDLTEMTAPEQLIAKLPLPPPPAAPPAAPPATPENAAPLAPPPLPTDKTVILDDAPRAPLPPPPAAAEPEPEPEPEDTPAARARIRTEARVIDLAALSTKLPPRPPETKKDDAPAVINVGQGDFVAHRGHEARFGRSMMADYYSYEATEFSGQFTTRDNRTISIIDARDTKYGRFLIYDSKNKTLRRLKEFSKYVYTIGPSVDADEPVTGTVTFLAKNDRIERFILMTDDDRMAHFPAKVHVREKDVTFAARGASPGAQAETLAGQTTLPPSGADLPGVVLTYGDRCVESGLVQGFTRSLSASGLAVLSLHPRGCPQAGAAPGQAAPPARVPSDPAQSASDTAAAVDYFAGLAQTDPARLGIWGNGPGAAAALRTAMRPGTTRPAYLVCLLDDAVEPDALPDRAELARLTLPVLWIITGRDLTRWDSFVATLERLRDNRGRPFSIVLAPVKQSRDGLDARDEDAGWVEQVTEDHARLGASWIQGLAR